MASQNLPSYDWVEINKHNSEDSLWLVVDGKVYDVTKFRDDHPGGEEVLLENAGTDATAAFLDVGHSAEAIETREKYLIGVVSIVPSPRSEPSRSCCTGYSFCRDRVGMKKAALAVGVVAIALVLIMAYRKYK